MTKIAVAGRRNLLKLLVFNVDRLCHSSKNENDAMRIPAIYTGKFNVKTKSDDKILTTTLHSMTFAILVKNVSSDLAIKIPGIARNMSGTRAVIVA